MSEKLSLKEFLCNFDKGDFSFLIVEESNRSGSEFYAIFFKNALICINKIRELTYDKRFGIKCRIINWSQLCMMFILFYFDKTIWTNQII
jgi:hypothetical protein